MLPHGDLRLLDRWPLEHSPAYFHAQWREGHGDRYVALLRIPARGGRATSVPRVGGHRLDGARRIVDPRAGARGDVGGDAGGYTQPQAYPATPLRPHPGPPMQYSH